MTAASESSVPHSADVEWFYLHDDVQIGPVSEERLMHAVKQGLVKPDTPVWQKAFDRWKAAANIPMIAINLRENGATLPSEFPNLSRRTGPTQLATRQADGPFVTQPPAVHLIDDEAVLDLDDAVTEDEAVEPVIDAQQVREILERTSRNPPERSIPPASVTSTPTSSGVRARKPWGNPRLVSLAGASLLTIAAFAAWTGGESQGRQHPADAAASAASVASAPTIDARLVKPEAPLELDGSRKTSLPSILKGAELRAPTPTAEVLAKVATPDAPQAGSTESVQASELVRVESGLLDAQLFVKKLKRALPMFDQQCWDKARAPVGTVDKNPSITIELAVDRLGNVYDIKSSKAPEGYRGAGHCIIGRIRGWKFPRMDQGSRAVMTVARVRG